MSTIPVVRDSGVLSRSKDGVWDLGGLREPAGDHLPKVYRSGWERQTD